MITNPHPVSQFLDSETSKPSCLYRAQLKNEIKQLVLANNQWKADGAQLSLFHDGSVPGLLQQIFESKNHFLLLDIYDLVFRDGHAYQDVHSLLHEVLEEYELLNLFKPWITDAGIMMVTALNEYNKHYAQ